MRDTLLRPGPLMDGPTGRTQPTYSVTYLLGRVYISDQADC